MCLSEAPLCEGGGGAGTVVTPLYPCTPMEALLGMPHTGGIPPHHGYSRRGYSHQSVPVMDAILIPQTIMIMQRAMGISVTQVEILFYAHVHSVIYIHSFLPIPHTVYITFVQISVLPAPATTLPRGLLLPHTLLCSCIVFSVQPVYNKFSSTSL